MTDEGWRVRTDRCQRAGDTWGDYLDRFAAQGDVFAEPLTLREWAETASPLVEGPLRRRTSATLLGFARTGEAMRRILPSLAESAAAMQRFAATAAKVNEALTRPGTGAFERLAVAMGGEIRVKRLRHGRERTWIRWARPAAAAPWKVAR